jgi:hypothetical protein
MRSLLFVDLINNAEQVIDHNFNPELLPYLTLRRSRSGLEKIDLPTGQSPAPGLRICKSFQKQDAAFDYNGCATSQSRFANCHIATP